MLLLEFFKRESRVPKTPIFVLAIISGIASSIVLAVINEAAAIVAGNNTELQYQYFFMYIISLVLFIYTRKTSTAQALIITEAALRNIRVRIADKLRKSELNFIENKGQSEIYTYLTQDANMISQAAFMLVAAANSGVVLIFSLFYIAWLSWIGFLLTIIAIILGIFAYLIHASQEIDLLRAMTNKEAEFFSKLNHVLNGFKEIKINRNKSDDLFNDIEIISEESEKLKVAFSLHGIIDLIFTRTFSMIALGILVFILPIFNPTHAEVTVKITATLLFIMGPLEVLISSMPMFNRATIAIENLYRLEAELDQKHQYATQSNRNIINEDFNQFKQIALHNTHFQYEDAEGKAVFSVGPLSLAIKRQEILFIVGGNGSGKSTLLKLLTGLYYPSSGTINVDDDWIDEYTYPAYRELFSIIFTDFHLFDRLYGMPTVDLKRLRELLRMMELDKKTRYVDGHFTQLNLSTGQRKRLAFVTAVLENRPIYIFDEIAADQDPQFRKYFYEVLLKRLRDEGKTIIAVTHDDHYFHVADRIVKMEYGKIESIEESSEYSI